MAATAGELVAQVINRVGFDVSAAEGLALLSERHQTMCVRAELLKPIIELGVTVAGQADYALPSNVAAVRRVMIDGRKVRFVPEAESGDVCAGGWAVAVSATAGQSVRFAPAPSEAGLPVSALVILRPPPLEASDVPLVPEEFFRQLREGVSASLFAEDAEQAAVADRNEARFDTACEELRRQLRRARRSGPARIRVER